MTNAYSNREFFDRITVPVAKPDRSSLLFISAWFYHYLRGILMMGTIFGFNLKLRWKFLVILLVFSLTPLIVVTIISQRGTSVLSKVISDESRRKLTEIVSRELKLTAENSARVLLRTKDAMEFYRHVLAGEAERALAERSRLETPQIYFSGDFDDPRT
jgi:ABC-type multidrug transport system fused ATPase/permease subunit